MFLPEDADIPLSRRPRMRLDLSEDGAAGIFMPGPDDRYVREPGTWRNDGGTIVVRDARGAVRARVVSQSPTRLVVILTEPHP